MKILEILIPFLSLRMVFASDETNLTSVIETDKGLIRGVIKTTVLKSIDYAAFLGIPYVEPPIGKLRFKPPVDKKPWNGIMNATSEGTMCSQFDWLTSSIIGSEDCLFLNVFTPHTIFDESISKPVMVFIHGGGYAMGSSKSSIYGPDFILDKDVIVVSFNYRLNVFGFLNLNHEKATGNMGLKDQNQALKWVNRNIAKFGGDPKKVTIFGQSAGAASVDLQILSDLSVGLFQQSISMSGSPLCLLWGFQVRKDAEQKAFALGSLLGTNTDNKDELMETLLNASPSDIVNATLNFTMFAFRPTIESTEIAKNEEKFLTQCTLDKYLTGNYTKGPHMMGMTFNEMIFFKIDDEALIRFSESALHILENASLLANLSTLTNITTAFKDGNMDIPKADLEKLLMEVSDLIFNGPIDAKQRMMNGNNGYPIYYYRFSFDSAYSLHKLLGINLDGATHVDEMPYLFFMQQMQLMLDLPDFLPTREKMVRLWTNFAKYGNPTPDNIENGEIGIKWIESGDEGRHLEIDKELSMGSRPISYLGKSLQSAGISISPVLNDCSNDLSSKVNNWIADTFSSIATK